MPPKGKKKGGKKKGKKSGAAKAETGIPTDREELLQKESVINNIPAVAEIIVKLLTILSLYIHVE